MRELFFLVFGCFAAYRCFINFVLFAKASDEMPEWMHSSHGIPNYGARGWVWGIGAFLSFMASGVFTGGTGGCISRMC